MLENIKAVIFDMDGTLVDSMWVWSTIDIRFLDNCGYDYSDMLSNLQGEIEGMSFYETAKYFIQKFKLTYSPEDLMLLWNDMAFEAYKNEVFVKHGVMDFLRYLKDRGIKMGIATSNSRKLAETCIERNNIGQYFDYMLTGDDVSKGKPDPEIYLRVAKQLGVEPENCLVFEDVPKGIMAGKNAGMTVIAVEDDASMHLTDIKKELADYYIESYLDILKGLYENE